MDQVDEAFDIDREELDIDEEEIMEKLEASPDGRIQAEMEAASEIWGQRIEEGEDSEELEMHKERIDGMLDHLNELQNSVSDLQEAVEIEED